MVRLGVNIDHVATLRQARRGAEPDPVGAAVLALLGGADGITVHLREDRRHVQDRDVRLLMQTVRTGVTLELAAASDVLAEIALRNGEPYLEQVGLIRRRDDDRKVDVIRHRISASCVIG